MEQTQEEGGGSEGFSKQSPLNLIDFLINIKREHFFSKSHSIPPQVYQPPSHFINVLWIKGGGGLICR